MKRLCARQNNIHTFTCDWVKKRHTTTWMTLSCEYNITTCNAPLMANVLSKPFKFLYILSH